MGTLVSTLQDGRCALVFRRGVDAAPVLGDQVLLPTREQLQAIVEGDRSATRGRVLLGQAPLAGNAPVHVDPDRLFGRHLAVLGNTGSGKSCTVAGLLRQSINEATNAREQHERAGPPNARFILLDPHGEYAHAFSDLDVRLFQVEKATNAAQQLKVPAWLWNGEEWAAFTTAAPGVQRPTLFKALRHLRAGAEPPNSLARRVARVARRYERDFRLAVAVGPNEKGGGKEDVADLLSSTADEFGALSREATSCHSPLGEPLKSVQVAATRLEQEAREGLPSKGKQWHRSLAPNRIADVEERLADVLDLVEPPTDKAAWDHDQPRPFPVERLPDYVDGLAAQSQGRDIAQFVDTLNLRIRDLTRRRRLASIALPPDGEEIALSDWLADVVGDDGANGQLSIIDLSLVPSDVVQIVVAVLARLTFEAHQRYRHHHRRDLPTVLVLEEAHRFVHRAMAGQEATGAERACGRVFDRIAREGRKLGLGLVLCSQRPSELSPTVLSQCSTFLLHRIVNRQDQDLVRRMVPDGMSTLLRELPSLPTRRAILLGWAASAPVLVEVDELHETQRPDSADPAFWGVWTGRDQRDVDWKPIAEEWAGTRRMTEGSSTARKAPEKQPAATQPADDDIPF
ncbi:MAG: ATP-binding protein [Acidobacteriota bacterium]|nr:ATP-binding protein [Acidobacteriota bacterium]